MLSHIDDDEENECKYVGAEYHSRVFKAADIAVENLIMNGIIEAMHYAARAMGAMSLRIL